ncbi:hypothetical protein D9M70_380710 [compost metagenome]
MSLNIVERYCMNIQYLSEIVLCPKQPPQRVLAVARRRSSKSHRFRHAFATFHRPRVRFDCGRRRPALRRLGARCGIGVVTSATPCPRRRGSHGATFSTLDHLPLGGIGPKTASLLRHWQVRTHDDALRSSPDSGLVTHNPPPVSECGRLPARLRRW